VELPLDGGKIGVDVRVVEFEVVEDGRARPVVQELGPLVEERRVVLVGLDHERPAAKTRRHAEVLRHAADQKAGVQPGVFQNPRQQRRRRGLAMRAGHRQHVPAAQHLLAEPLRTGRVGQVVREDVFDERVAARQRIADHVQVRRTGERSRLVALLPGDAGQGELLAHRRINTGIAAAHAVAERVRKLRQAAHEGAADSKDVHVHHSSPNRVPSP
jgi:hypothetical protein